MRRIPLISALVLLTACGSSPVVNAPIVIPTPNLTGITTTPKPDQSGVPVTPTTRQPNMLATLIADATRVTVLPYSAKLNGTWQHQEPDYRLIINLSIGELRMQHQGAETILPVALDSEYGKMVVLKVLGRDTSSTFRFVTDDVIEWDEAPSNVKTLKRVQAP